MSAFTIENPVFVTWIIATPLPVLKVMGQGWMTVYRMMKVGGYAAREDLRPGLINKAPDPGQLEVNDSADRSRRMHRNELENTPSFWAAGLAFVAVAPPLWLTQVLMYGFVGARAAHAPAYASAQSHEVRATFHTVGSLIVMAMAGYVLVAVV